ncbi:MAG: hypothetical protein DI629_02545 [Mesorhizobium amorphae]|nr:MAG: hypothetical protein DI629_02545 [Mesorhizobium amorphae]
MHPTKERRLLTPWNALRAALLVLVCCAVVLLPGRGLEAGEPGRDAVAASLEEVVSAEDQAVERVLDASDHVHVTEFSASQQAAEIQPLLFFAETGRHDRLLASHRANLFRPPIPRA